MTQANGVEAFSIGVENWRMKFNNKRKAFEDLLIEVAGSKERVITVSSFNDLLGISSNLASQIINTD